MPHLEFFPFRYRDPRTRKWIRARYLAEQQEIQQRYPEFEITGPAEIRDVDPDAHAFSPHAAPFKVMKNAESRRFSERPPELTEPAAIDTAEAFLDRLFLRGDVTYCARRGRFAAMNERRAFTRISACSRCRTPRRKYPIYLRRPKRRHQGGRR